MKHRLHTLAAALALACPCIGFAYDEPTVNLGATSFLDGAPPAGPGLYFTAYGQYYSANHLKDNSGNDLPLPKQEVQVSDLLAQLTYMAPTSVFGASPGVQFLLPWVIDAHTDDGLNGAALKGNPGVGDLEIGPFLQFAPVMGAQGPKFVQRVEFTFIVPTGRYQNTAAVNPGSNFWSFNPYWAGTYWFTPKLTASWRLHYLWNAKNDQPSPAFGSGITNTQAGQAVHTNLTVDYGITPQLRAGLNSYWLLQFTDTDANGQAVHGRKERVLALGPGAIYSFSRDDHLFVNVYFEEGARNRPEGDRVQLRWVHHF
ncbi:MAG: transporter [Nevskia sp.]|nr:transporter [Nevskia sp.]